MKLAQRLEGISESSTLKMNALARELISQGKKVINLTAGEPDFPVPERVKLATINAIHSNFSKYTPVGGIPELRAKVAHKLKVDNQLEYKPDEILLSCGAKHSIFNFFLATLNPGDEVIIPSPYWVSYPEMVKLCGAVPVILEAKDYDKFKINPAQLKNALSKKTKAFILNSPSNPTGMVYSKQEMQALAKVLEGTEVWVVSDEIYEKLTYVGEFQSFAALSEDAFRRTVTINGFSKAYAMTGWRLGYAAGNKALISAMALIQGQSTSNPTSIIQKAALEALELSDADLNPMKIAFQKRCDVMEEIFSHSNKLSFVKPDGAFYYFLNIERCLGKSYNKQEAKCVLRSGDDLAFYLLEKANVVTVPGSGFGAPSHLRVSFAVSDSEVQEGAKAIVDALENLK